MENKLYLAAFRRQNIEAGFAQQGFSFSYDGSFFAPEGYGNVWILDDRCLPSENGVQTAVRYFQCANYSALLCDFERPRTPLLASLLSQLDKERLIVPPQYADLPHSAVFLPPYQPNKPFQTWLKHNRSRYGSIVLDMQPIGAPCRHGSYSNALCCNYLAEYQNGKQTFQFYDTPETFLRRIELASVPCITLQSEFSALRALIPDP